MTTLHTPRLDLTPVSAADTDELLALFNDPNVGRYLLDGEPVSREWVDGEIASSVARFDESGCGLWAVRMRPDSGEPDPPDLPDTIAGVVGLRPFFDPPDLQLLYALHPRAWGRGLATEAARAVVHHAFGVLGFDEIKAATDEPNRASVAVLERLGMEPWKVEGGEPHRTLFYRVCRADWMDEPSTDAHEPGQRRPG